MKIFNYKVLERTKWVLIIMLGVIIILINPSIVYGQVQHEDPIGQRTTQPSALDTLWSRFENPGPDSRPGVYWYFLDGNQNRSAMTEDLTSMVESGIGHAIFLEVDLDIPAGPIKFMSDRWQTNFSHAADEAGRLGLKLSLGAGPGWAGSGGPWVSPEESMKHLRASRTHVRGPTLFSDTLKVPRPRPPSQFAGLTPELAAARESWWRDVAVLAVPRGKNASPECKIEHLDLKALFETKPYSIWNHVPRYVPPPEATESPPCKAAVDPDEVVPLTGRMDSTGHLTWNVPAGEWTIFRLAVRSTGVTTRPAPAPGHGFEVDKLASGAFADHFESFHKPLLEHTGASHGEAGWTGVHLDSWEMSSQNWTRGFQEEFRKRRGYNPRPYLPAYFGTVIGSRDTTEQFLWDVRKTAQELLLENYARSLRGLAHEHGLRYSNQPYDMNPAGDLDLGAVADVSSCEFWAAGNGPDTVYSCLEAVSLSNVLGRDPVQAEAFTTMPSGYVYSPRRMKNQTDWAFSMGINSLFFHTFTHQPLGAKARPGMTLGPHGIHWHRNQPWWPWVRSYHEYVRRLSSLLRVGEPVSDILYLTPEGVPHIFLPPEDATMGEGVLRFKQGYQFDAVTPRLLADHVQVTKEGRITLNEEGAAYKLLVLPARSAMTPKTVGFLSRLVAQGATVVGPPPSYSPSLSGGTAADARVRRQAAQLWDLETADVERWTTPAHIRTVDHGDGQVVWGSPLFAFDSRAKPTENAPAEDSLYTSYEQTARLLGDMGTPRDLSSSAPFRFHHRRLDAADIYFVSNPSDSLLTAPVTFRVRRNEAEIWNPLKVARREVEVSSVDDGKRREIALSLGPRESTVVVFHSDSTESVPDSLRTSLAHRVPLSTPRRVVSVQGPWTVSFDSAFGGPSVPLRWDSLASWDSHERESVRYYSGTATYSTTFDSPVEETSGTTSSVAVDLGNVYEVARVSVNGRVLDTLWTEPFRVSIPPEVLKARGNTLSIDVANNWNNRLVGDSREDRSRRRLTFPSGLLGGGPVDAGEYTFTTSAWYEENERDLQMSGLIGPVTLVVP